MSPKQPLAQIKLSLTTSEIEGLDKAVAAGEGTSRADLCRKALIIYLEKVTA